VTLCTTGLSLSLLLFVYFAAQDGDSVVQVASMFHTSVKEILRLNPDIGQNPLKSAVELMPVAATCTCKHAGTHKYTQDMYTANTQASARAHVHTHVLSRLHHCLDAFVPTSDSFLLLPLSVTAL
jgi:hypothetical protein